MKILRVLTDKPRQPQILNQTEYLTIKHERTKYFNNTNRDVQTYTTLVTGQLSKIPLQGKRKNIQPKNLEKVKHDMRLLFPETNEASILKL